MDLIYKMLMFVFSKLPLLKKLDGYKRMIGDALIVVTAALAALQELRPELTWIASVTAILGLIVKAIGEAHAKAKEKDAAEIDKAS